MRRFAHKGMGFKPDAPRAVARMRALGEDYAHAAERAGLLNPERVEPTRPAWVSDQGQLGSCFGFASSGALYELGHGKGSQAHAWAMGRAVSGQNPRGLYDDGVSLSATRWALRTHGVAPLVLWEPGVEGFGWHAFPPAVVRESAQCANLDIVEVPGSSPRAPLVVDGIARGYVPLYVTHVDEGYDDAVGLDVLGPARGVSRGLHIVTGRVGFFRDGSSPVFLTVSSWGAEHGDGGIVYFSAERVDTCPAVYLVRGAS